MVEVRGLEPLTSWLPARRLPLWGCRCNPLIHKGLAAMAGVRMGLFIGVILHAIAALCNPSKSKAWQLPLYAWRDRLAHLAPAPLSPGRRL